MPDPAATDSAKRNAEQLVLEQHLKGMKENERRAGPKRLETVVADRSGPESRGGDDIGPYVHYESPEEVLLTAGYHAQPAVEQPPPGKPLYDFTIGK